ncbi:MAG TPA: chemotaxis protein CheA [Clostridiaceae bacterium]|nr:chemotaxis protein CheA [Clostridiaceae bacterium]HBX49010.1 chemotaxis protein CheA [Clostridiaceae bacterium]
MDMSQYLDMFIEESDENLQNLNEWILELEKNPDDKETINSIFRAAHTLKGMSASMGFNDIAELTHKMEDILDEFRNDKLKVNSEVITVLFKCLDTLEKMVDGVRDGSSEKTDISGITKMLDDIAASGNSSNGDEAAATIEEAPLKEKAPSNSINFELNVYDEDIIKQAKEKNYNVFKAEVNLYNDCKLKSARAFLVYKNLEESGEIVKSIPSIEDIEQEKFDYSFVFVYVTNKTAEEVKKLIESVSEIESVNVSEVEINNTEEAQSKEAKPKEESNNKNVKSQPKKDDRTSKKAHQFVRVDLEKMDKFMNLVGELVIHRTRLEQLSSNYKLTDLHETLEQVGRITSDLQDLVMKIRMLPVEKVFNRFPRMIRDLSNELGKEIELVIKGEDTELDRTVIDEIGEPLLHLIRNSADHGIEPAEERIKAGKKAAGTIKLIAYQEGNKAIIKVEDDGRGLNVEKIKQKAEKSGIDTSGMSEQDIKNLIFMQGFSTSEKVTDISGRGVGMDVVKTKISAIGGTIELLSEEGKGTSVIIRLPLTLSIIQALLVKVGDETFAISLGFIDRVISINTDEIKLTNNKEVIIYRDNVIPLIRLSDKLNIKGEDGKDKFVVIAKSGEKTAGLLVDSLSGQQEIVIKNIGKTLSGLKEYVGATILGNGLVTLILDVAAIV